MEELLIILGMLVLGGLIPTVVNAVCFPPGKTETRSKEDVDPRQIRQQLQDAKVQLVRDQLSELSLRELEEIDRRLETQATKKFEAELVRIGCPFARREREVAE